MTLILEILQYIFLIFFHCARTQGYAYNHNWAENAFVSNAVINRSHKLQTEAMSSAISNNRGRHTTTGHDPPKHLKVWTKWPTICRWHFRMYFLEAECMKFDLGFTEMDCCRGMSNIWCQLWSRQCLGAIWHQTINRTNIINADLRRHTVPLSHNYERLEVPLEWPLFNDNQLQWDLKVLS